MAEQQQFVQTQPGAPPPVEGPEALKFAQGASPDELMRVMDYVLEVKIKQKAFLLEAAGGGSCIPNNYSVKDVNGTNLLYGMEYSHPCSRCCCGPNRKMRLDIVPSAAVEDASGDAKFDAKELMAEAKKCCSYGGAAADMPVAFTLDRSMEGSPFPCCRFPGACIGCCHDRYRVQKGPAPPRGEEDTREVVSSLKQASCGGVFTPTWEIYDAQGQIAYHETGEGGICESCCPGFCLCACTDNKFAFKDSQKQNEVGHVTRVNPKDCAGWCRQALTDADSYDVLFPQTNKEQKAALLASMLATDLLFFDDGGDVGCECTSEKWETRIKMFILYFCGCPVNVYFVIDWKKILEAALNGGGGN